MDFGRLIEEQLRKAREDGKFDNLRGHGQPLNLDENPLEDPRWQMASDMLKRNGFRPEWLEDDLSSRHELPDAQQALRRSAAWRKDELKALEGQGDARALEQRHWVEQEWTKAQERFRNRLVQLNKAIFNYNLKTPSTQLQRTKLDVEAELAKALAEPAA